MVLRALLYLVVISVSLPQISHAKLFGNRCAILFEQRGIEALSPTDSRLMILKSALGETKISLTRDQRHLEKILKSWDLQKSTPYKMELLAQQLVMKKDHLPAENFFAWVREVFRRDNPEKELNRVLFEGRLLRDELLYRLEIYGHKKQNSKLDNFRELTHNHYYKSKLTRFVAVNLLIAGTAYGIANTLLPGMEFTFHKFIYPFYIPLINPIKALKPTQTELDLVKRVGFDEAYPTLRENHKVANNVVPMFRRLPYVVLLSVAGYLGYNYYSFKAQEVETKDVQENLEIGRIPESHPLFRDWRRDFIIENKREPDMKNPADKESWQFVEELTYMAWKDSFEAQHRRAPNLKNREDLMAWQEFLAGIQSPQ